MLGETAARPRRAHLIVAWALGNAAVGYLTSYPLLMIVVYGYYVRAKLIGDVSSPFRDGEADVPLYFILGTGVPLVIVAVLSNRAIRHRLGLRAWRAAVFWAVTIAVLAAPFAVFALGQFTVKEMLGKGLFW